MTGSDDQGFRLDNLSGMKVTGVVAKRRLDYYIENRVSYLCIARGHGQGIEGTSPYEIGFDYNGEEVTTPTCGCHCGYSCERVFASMLQLGETLKLLEEHDGFDWNEGGYAAAISQSAFFSYRMSKSCIGNQSAGEYSKLALGSVC